MCGYYNNDLLDKAEMLLLLHFFPEFNRVMSNVLPSFFILHARTRHNVKAITGEHKGLFRLPADMNILHSTWHLEVEPAMEMNKVVLFCGENGYNKHDAAQMTF